MTFDDDFPRTEPRPTLPPRKTPDEVMATALQGGSRWNCEDRLRLTLDAFVECWPDNEPRSKLIRSEHYHAARKLVDEVGEMEAPAFVRWTSAVIQGEFQSLTIKTCMSLMFLVPRWRARERADPMKWWSKPCPKCFTIHHPDGACNGEETEDE